SSNLDVAEIGLELIFIDGGPHIDRLIQPVADFQRLRAIHQSVHELPVDTLLHDDAAGRCTTLPGRSKRPPEPALDGEVEISVIEHDHRVLAAKLKRTMLEALGSSGADNASDFGRTGQRDRTNIRMLRQRSAHARTEAGYNVDDSAGKARIRQRPHQIECG